jgi:phosphatidate phosphatase PAH1
LDLPSEKVISELSSVGVVLDIDGTLTPDVYKLHAARPDAAEAARILVNKGYEIIYLTSRMPGFQLSIPGWLAENGFPEGLIFTPQSMKEHQNPVRFKTGVLQELTQFGWEFAFAYGDSSTDFKAYENAGVQASAVYAVKRQGNSSCEPGAWVQCLEGWSAHLPYLSNLPQNESSDYRRANGKDPIEEE